MALRRGACSSHPGIILEVVKLDFVECSSVLVGDSAGLGRAARVQVVPDAGLFVAAQDGFQRPLLISVGNIRVDDLSQLVHK